MSGAAENASRSPSRIPKRTFPQFDGSLSTPPRAHPPRHPPNFRSDFGNALSDPPRPKQRARTQPGPVVPLESLVPDRPLRQIGPPRPSAVEAAPVNATTAAPVVVLPPPLLQPVAKPTKIIVPPIPHPRPSTPPRTRDLTSFISLPPRPSKPVSSTHIARATDVLTDSGRAELLGLTLVRDGATPMEKAVRRGLEATPRKAGAGKEIRYTRGGLAERASQVIGWRTTSLSLWRKSNPSPESARMLVEIEQVLSSPRPPPQRGALATSVCLARCQIIGEENRSILVLLSVPGHDARNVALGSLKRGSRVLLWDPLEELSSVVLLCSRFVLA